MIFTAILDLEARRKAKEASKARRRKIIKPSETTETDETVFGQASIGHSLAYFVPYEFLVVHGV